MFRIGIACGVLLLAASNTARAIGASRSSAATTRQHHHGLRQLPHPARRRRQAGRRPALSGGGLTLATPAFTVTAPNITPDAETGIGSWSDAEIKHALLTGMRPDHGHLAGVALAAVMPPISTRRCCRTISTRWSPIFTPSSRSGTRCRSRSTRRRRIATPTRRRGRF